MAAIARTHITDKQARRERRTGTTLMIILLTLAAIFVLLPVIWTFSTSLRVPRESFMMPPRWLPTDWQWENYAKVFDYVPFGRFILNSLLVSGTSVLGQITTATLAAYAFARLRFPYKNVLFLILMAGLMIPFFVTVIPVFRMMAAWGLVDTLYALILPSLVTPFGVFLLRQFFRTIPNDLEDAAKMDGAGPLQIFRYIFLPLGAPGIAVLAILAFNSHWNDFFRPFIFINNSDHYTIPLGIVTLQGPLSTGELSVVLAGVMMSLIPMIILIVFAQKWLIEGIVLTGSKG